MLTRLCKLPLDCLNDENVKGASINFIRSAKWWKGNIRSDMYLMKTEGS